MSNHPVPVRTPIVGGDVVTVGNRDVQTLTVGVNAVASSGAAMAGELKPDQKTHYPLRTTYSRKR